MTDKTYPPVVIVDEHDNEIGTAMLQEAWQNGLYHRIVVIFVFDDRGRILLQLRSPQVGIFPNCWDQAAGGHVDEGQSYEQAASNEVAEELGLHDVDLTVMGTHRSNLREGEIISNQFERVYKAHIPHNTILSLEPSEISKLQWFSPQELRALIADKPDSFTPLFLQDLHQYFPDFLA